MGEQCSKQSTEKQEFPKILITTSWTARLHKLCNKYVLALWNSKLLFFFFFFLFLDD